MKKKYLIFEKRFQILHGLTMPTENSDSSKNTEGSSGKTYPSFGVLNLRVGNGLFCYILVVEETQT